MTTTQTSVVQDLGTLAHRLSHPAGARCVCEPPQVLADRPDGTVVRSGAIVAKAHAADSDHEALAARIALAAAPQLTGILLPPLTAPGRSLTAPEPSGGPQHPEPSGPPAPAPRPVTLWPLGAPVDPTDPEAAPWAEAAVLLARLHRTEPPFRLPAMRGPAKAARAVARMRAALPGDPAVLPVLVGLAGPARLGPGRGPGTRPEVRFPVPRGPAPRPARTPPRSGRALAAHRRGRRGNGRSGLGPRASPPPGTPPDSWPPRTGSPSWTPTGPPEGPRYRPTGIPGPNWTSRPAR